jgi:hypothetical protein
LLQAKMASMGLQRSLLLLEKRSKAECTQMRCSGMRRAGEGSWVATGASVALGQELQRMLLAVAAIRIGDHKESVDEAGQGAGSNSAAMESKTD